MDSSALYRAMLPTPLGDAFFYTQGGQLVGLGFAGPYADSLFEHLARHTGQTPADAPASPLVKEAARQLKEYLSGSRRGFDLPLGLAGTDFQRRVWRQLLDIPYGTTVTYGQIAARCNTQSARAVGSAVGSNPLCIVVPCHRVLAANGKVGQYSGGQGPQTKAWLLSLEGAEVGA